MSRELAIIPLAAFALAACGSEEPGVSIDGAWARTSAEGQTTGAIYFDITADEDDALFAAAVPASVAAAAEIHEAAPADPAIGHDDEMAGDHAMHDDDEMVMLMRELSGGLPLPAGETVSFQPGGYHLMLLDLVEPLEAGDQIELTLDFRNADDVTVTVEVAESAP